MPNHVTNYLRIDAEGDVLEKIKSEISSGEGDEYTPIDFDKIIPRPESLNITSGSYTDNAIAILLYQRTGEDKRLREMLTWHWVKNEGITNVDDLVKSLIDNKQADFEMAEKALNNMREYGHADWYSWSIEKWGTKWNAYSTEDNGDEIIFQTAWSCPINIFIALSKRYPDVEFTVRYADEDFGSNVGEFGILNGEETWSDIPDSGSPEAYRLAMDILNDEFRVECCLEEIDPDSTPSNWGNYEKIMCDFAYEYSLISSTYPECVLKHLEEKAVARENYELASLIKEALEENAE